MKLRYVGIAALLLTALLFSGCNKKAPVVTCSASPEQITQGENANIKSDVVVKKGTKITYAWSADSGKVSGKEGTAVFDSTGLNPGKYAVSVTVTDKHKKSGQCSATVTVEKKYLPPTVACSTSSDSIQAGESVKINAKADSPDGSPLKYSWTINGQSQAADSPEFIFGSAGRQPGTFTIAATVNTGKFTASCSSNVNVREIPIPPPTISCSAQTVDVESGGSIQLQTQVKAERATPTVSWSATGGKISGSGETANFSADGLNAGSYIVTATVDNNHGDKASCSTIVNVSQKIKISGFPERKDHVNNEAKAVLDNLATQMKNDPHLRASIAGYTDGSKREAKIKGLGLKRAQAIVDYLTGKGINASQFTATDGGAGIISSKTEAGRKENRHAEILLSVH
jgi:outer membrane protein OmpA-like peptidoglycan-associated protein